MINENAFNPDAATRARWMVVDDNDSIRQTVANLLAAITDAEVCCFSSGAEAVAALSAQPNAFELVVTDFEMPGMNGVELCRCLLEIMPTQKILLATGSEVFSESAAIESGFCGLLLKPFSLVKLIHALKRAELSVAA